MAETVKYRSVAVTVYPIGRPDGREYWQFKRSDGSQVTRATKEKARAAALREAQTIFKGGLAIEDLTPDQVRGIKRMMEVDPELRMVDEFLVWHGKRAPKKMLGAALDEFFAAKEANRGRSAQNVKTLKTRLSILTPLRDRIISTIIPGDLALRTTLAPRTRKNIRGSLVTFFRWCVEQEYLPMGEKTAPERLEKPISRRKVPVTYSAEQMEILLEHVSMKFLPWLAGGGFAGIRMDELHPLPGGEKEPLDWLDFDWDRKVIRMRPETDKNGHGRIIPILPVLRHWLFPIRQNSGPLISCLPSSGNDPETSRIGKFIGGWKPNALRHSYVSYRSAEIGLAKTAMECGNSESEAKKSYNDAKTRTDSRKWFGIGMKKKKDSEPAVNRVVSS